jgi:ABC-type cobalamin/Fe3+-siderophores transport system ATPase subunit
LVLHDIALALSGADRVAVFAEGSLRSIDIPQKVYESGVLDEVFDINVHKMDTPHGVQYYCTTRG